MSSLGELYDDGRPCSAGFVESPDSAEWCSGEFGVSEKTPELESCGDSMT